MEVRVPRTFSPLQSMGSPPHNPLPTPLITPLGSPPRKPLRLLSVTSRPLMSLISPKCPSPQDPRRATHLPREAIRQLKQATHLPREATHPPREAIRQLREVTHLLKEATHPLKDTLLQVSHKATHLPSSSCSRI